MKKNTIFKNESEFNLNSIKTVRVKDINYLVKRALKSKRKRYRFCLHENTNHLTQEMIICFNGFTYIRPHRHLSKRSESYHMIKGSMDVYLFNNNGKVKDIIRLNANKSDKNSIFFYKLSKSIFHTIYPRSNKLFMRGANRSFNEKIYKLHCSKNGCSEEEAKIFSEVLK